MVKHTLISLAALAGLALSSCDNSSPSAPGTETRPVAAAATDSHTADSAAAKDTLAAKVGRYISTRFLTAADARTITPEQRKFRLYNADLNNDGTDEVFVSFASPYFCGTGGCTVLLLDSNLKLITRFSPARNFTVENQTENGWRVLLTKTDGTWRALRYQNGTYPSNPTVAEAAAAPTTQAELLFDENSSKSKTYTF